MAPLTPVHFFSHGSTMMLGEESKSADYWKKCGDEALAHGIEHVVMMGAHWASRGDEIHVATNPKPAKSPVAYVHPSKYVSYELVPDLPMAERVLSLLQTAGFNASANPTFDWIHDTYLILIRMFPTRCPPTTIVSMNARYDPHYHVKVGSALRGLRREGNVLFVGTGGAVHNLYRNRWAPMLRYRDTFAMETPPEAWAMEFRQEVQDALTKSGGGPALRRAVTMLMKMPMYREAHGTDDHFMAAQFVAGLCGDWEDEGQKVELGAEDWELTNMCNSQFTLGHWGKEVAVGA
ncbi:aromatic ring-opening dioxygenase family protein [Viridothelium virens]|uniref:Aromatic ring-opening dioxygenase family protein n=1 Tax=Viridothelium virens TaxID=1048519 RepID=A0A6A6GWI1_VIRVR|nr:aromatic ring-opening dioxygenase family protein [Viridothelium virens]